MSPQIDRGLFKENFNDHHAVLGVSVNASKGEVRKRYLKIARKLHPDSNRSKSEEEKKQANELLSKLVNPAYEQLSQDNREYGLMLKRMGQRLAEEKGKATYSGEAAKQLFQAGANLESLYKSSLQNLAAKQYESLGQVLDNIAEISELNLVYLIKGGKVGSEPTPVGAERKTDSGAGRGKTDSGTGGGKTDSGTGEVGGSRASAYMRRAQGYLEKNNFARAVLELREALKLEPNNANCHSLLGITYLKQKQTAMAKVHINKALQLNPRDERALKVKKFLEGAASKGSSTNSSTSSQTDKSSKSEPRKKPDKAGGGGLFGGFFGGNK
ncbi:MAG: tetratricopeptide repeat protein [Coleofasciculaceae cyanobacterium]